MAWFAIAAAVASTIFSANAARAEGKQKQQAAEYQAQQLDQNAGQEEAAAQRGAMEEQRKSRLAQSRALALAAASGAGANDPTTLDIFGDLAQEGTYRSMLDIYEGEDKARLLRQQAASARYGGEVAVAASKTQATASILKGASSLWQMYSPGGAPGASSTGSGSVGGGSSYFR